ncbi:MAG: hypothetical protein CVU08_03405 [Bacteroidetes bacterium HGW-Bacteroidetes-3]|nr:MAG: hypothetical protein CVU08_03405 [Bacteroidetes bacterium HGW-Bacteroidetes-3]
MKKNIGIWIDTSQAVIVELLNGEHTIKTIESNIETRERIPGESKKYGRFGGQYLTYEKNRENKKIAQTNQFLKILLQEIENCEAIVLFGPSIMKTIFEKEIKNNLNTIHKLVGVFDADSMTENQVVAWVKDFYKNKK